MEQPTRRQILAGAAGLAASGVAGCVSGGRRSDPDPVAAETDTPSREEGTYTQAYESTIGSVVFVGDETGGGSGFVHDEYIVTNQHVVGEADRVDVRFDEGEYREAAVLATDVYSDLAVLSTDRPEYAQPLSFVETVPSVGTEVLALGSPFGLEASVSRGIISGTNRSLESPTGFSIPNTVQTDAGLDPGNSGGPVVTLDGEVTGVAVAGAGTSVGFAVSPLLARRVLPELFETGSYEHAYLGIGLLDVRPIIAEANDLEETRGVYVVDILEDGPANSPLRGADDEVTIDGRPVPVGGDVIVELAGETIDAGPDLGRVLALQLSPGQQVEAVVIRDGERVSLDVPIGARPEPDGPVLDPS